MPSASRGTEPLKPHNADQAASSWGLSVLQAVGSVSGSMLSTGNASKSLSNKSAGGGKTGCAWLSMARVELMIRASWASSGRFDNEDDLGGISWCCALALIAEARTSSH